VGGQHYKKPKKLIVSGRVRKMQIYNTFKVTAYKKNDFNLKGIGSFNIA